MTTWREAGWQHALPATRASWAPGGLCDLLSAQLHLALLACLSAGVTSLTEPSPKAQTEAVLVTRLWWMHEGRSGRINGKKALQSHVHGPPAVCERPTQWLWKDPTGSITAFLRSNVPPRLREDWQPWVEFMLTHSPPLSQVTARIWTPNKFLQSSSLPVLLSNQSVFNQTLKRLKLPTILEAASSYYGFISEENEIKKICSIVKAKATLSQMYLNHVALNRIFNYSKFGSGID